MVEADRCRVGVCELKIFQIVYIKKKIPIDNNREVW